MLCTRPVYISVAAGVKLGACLIMESVVKGVSLPQAEDPERTPEVDHPDVPLAAVVSPDSRLSTPATSSAIPRRYPFSLAPTFRIGQFNATPVVTTDELLAHLKLLGAFFKLQQDVRSLEEVGRTNSDGLWALFLARAVWRFDRWAKEFSFGEGPMEEGNCPPLDVAMVWHTYCLVKARLSFGSVRFSFDIFFPEPSHLLRRL